jgi:acyl carrier protein
MTTQQGDITSPAPAGDSFEDSVIKVMARQTGGRLAREERMSDLDFDSLDIIEFVHSLEETLGISISPFDLIDAVTVGDIVDKVSLVRG